MTEIKMPPVVVFQSILYRPGTQIDVSKYPEKQLYNHATGLIAYTENSIATLEAGGVYSMEMADSTLIKHAQLQPHPSLIDPDVF
jgi:hypothetical protein